MNPAIPTTNRSEGLWLLAAFLLSAVLLPSPACSEEPARLRSIRPLFEETDVQPKREPATATGAVSAYEERYEVPAAPARIRGGEVRPPISDLLNARPSEPLAAVESEELEMEEEQPGSEVPAVEAIRGELKAE